jgi:hypothetical protein
MTKRSVTESPVLELAPKSNEIFDNIMQFLPIIVSAITLGICYFLYKQIQSLQSEKEILNKIEEEFAKFIKEQSMINTDLAKKIELVYHQSINYDNLISDMQSNFNKSKKETVKTQENKKNPEIINSNLDNQNLREPIPSSIQTSFPISGEPSLSLPISTSLKTETTHNLDTESKLNVTSNVINIETLDEEIELVDDSSEEEN